MSSPSETDEARKPMGAGNALGKRLEEILWEAEAEFVGGRGQAQSTIGISHNTVHCEEKVRMVIDEAEATEATAKGGRETIDGWVALRD